MASPVADISSQSNAAQQQFPLFVKQSVGLVGAVVAAIPILTGFFGTVRIPVVGTEQQSKLMPMLATVLAGTLFLFLFWVRDQLAGFKAGLTGVLAIVLGVVFLVWTNLAVAPALQAATYLLGFSICLGGGSLLFIFGFVRRQERVDDLADLAPKLEPEEWRRLKDFAMTLIAVRQSIAERPIHAQSKKALASSARNLVAEYEEMLAKLRLGTLEIRGPAMDTIYSYFIEGVQQRFRALSRDDLEYWASNKSVRYLEINASLIERRREVSRVFLVKKGRFFAPEELEAISRQIRMGIQIRIAYLENCHRIVADDLDLDFGLFDDFAVSFWRRTADRVFRIRTSTDECNRHAEIYEKVVRECENVPNKAGQNRTVFESDKELEAWVSSLPKA